MCGWWADKTQGRQAGAGRQAGKAGRQVPTIDVATARNVVAVSALQRRRISMAFVWRTICRETQAGWRSETLASRASSKVQASESHLVPSWPGGRFHLLLAPPEDWRPGNQEDSPTVSLSFPLCQSGSSSSAAWSPYSSLATELRA